MGKKGYFWWENTHRSKILIAIKKVYGNTLESNAARGKNRKNIVTKKHNIVQYCVFYELKERIKHQI